MKSNLSFWQTNEELSACTNIRRKEEGQKSKPEKGP